MGLFDGIKNNWKKSEAAAIIQALLENSQKLGVFGFQSDPAQAANSLVGKAWDALPDVFSGKFGQRPHKLTTAAIALAYGISHSPDDEEQLHLLTALGNILGQVNTNGQFYPFNSTDEYLLLRASEVFTAQANKLPPCTEITSNKKDDESIKQWKGGASNFPYETFADWYVVYKDAAARTNKALAPQDGLYLIDLMEKEPLYRAFNDLIDPVTLGQNFGRQFDPLKMKWDNA